MRLLRVCAEDTTADYMAGAVESEAVHALLATKGRPMSARAPLIARKPPAIGAIRALLTRLAAEFDGAPYLVIWSSRSGTRCTVLV